MGLAFTEAQLQALNVKAFTNVSTSTCYFNHKHKHLLKYSSDKQFLNPLNQLVICLLHCNVHVHVHVHVHVYMYGD